MRAELSALAGIGGSGGITSGPGREQPGLPFHYIFNKPRLGDLIVEDIYGIGGSAVVAKVRSEAGHHHALKVFAPGYHRSLYDREVVIHSNLRHTNFIEFRGALSVPINDGQKDHDAQAILLEPAEQDLSKMLQRGGPVTPHRAIAIAGEVASAVDELHTNGLVYKDLTVKNILVSGVNNNSIKLCDLGSADVSPSKTESTFGINPQTAAPEQWKGETFPETDTHALTIIMYKLLTAEEFYVDGWPGSLALEDPESYQILVDNRVSKVPDVLEEVFRAGWALDPQQRPSPSELTQRASKVMGF